MPRLDHAFVASCRSIPWACPLLVLSLLASSCAATVQLTYRSDPDGATLKTSDGIAWGQTPVTLKYDVSDSFRQGQCMLLAPVSVQWSSGAERAVSDLVVCPANGRRQEYLFVRPAASPGAEIDAAV